MEQLGHSLTSEEKERHWEATWNAEFATDPDIKASAQAYLEQHPAPQEDEGE